MTRPEFEPNFVAVMIDWILVRRNVVEQQTGTAALTHVPVEEDMIS